MKGQIHLLNVIPSECNHSCETNKRIYEQTWLNDSILQIKTTASANCIGVHNPRLRIYGPLLSLEFDEFKIDTTLYEITHKKDNYLVADCNCVYQIVWKISGLHKNDNFILLLNDQLESEYKKNNLDKLLSSYHIETNNSHYAFLRNAIDKSGLKQGIQIFRENNITSLIKYLDGRQQTNR
jgi:hypothetical protein